MSFVLEWLPRNLLQLAWELPPAQDADTPIAFRNKETQLRWLFKACCSCSRGAALLMIKAC